MKPISSGWDRTCLHLASKMANPFCSAYNLLRYRLVAPLDPNQFENFSSPVFEVAFRTLICAGATITAAAAYAFPMPILGGSFLVGLMSKAFRYLGFSMQQNGYTHVRGNAEEKTLGDELKLMSWNICGLAGGFPINYGGLTNWHLRFENIAKTISEEDPDVLVLQEIVDTDLAEAIIKKFSSKYAHFFFHLGQNTIAIGSGDMVLSKCAFSDFSFTPFEDNPWEITRGFAKINVKRNPQDKNPSARILGTHLTDGTSQNAIDSRVSEINQMIASIAKEKLCIPSILTGDLNHERDLDGQAEFLNELLTHGYTGPKYTCTNKLGEKWDGKEPRPEQMCDYISLVRGTENGAHLKNVRLVEAFEEDFNTKTARSDHHALSGELVFGG